VLDQFSWEQWVRGEELLVNDEDDQESETDCHASNNMSRIPCVWLLAPVESDKEQSDTRDGQESADKVDTTEDLALGQSKGVDSWRWLVPDGNDNKANESKDANDERDISPAVLSKQLTVQGCGGKRHEAHDDVSDGDTALRNGNQFRDGSDGREQLNADTHARNDHGCDGSSDVLSGTKQNHGYNSE